MNNRGLASIIINNCNYAGFLPEAIGSALNQTYRHIEVIVVDDGSTDRSREVIASYGHRITPVLKENGGQTSALNAAFRVSRGQIIHFLDADDMLLPTAVERTTEVCLDPHSAKVHWPLLEIDTHSQETGKVWGSNLPQGDLREAVLNEGPDSIHHPPTTGNAFTRRFLENVLPLPEVENRFKLHHASADMILSGLAPLYGRIGRILEPQGYYRLHGSNGYSSLRFEDRLRRDVLTYNHLCSIVAQHCGRMGLSFDEESWKKNSWVIRLCRASQMIAALVPPGAALILVDEDHWKAGPSLMGRKCFPFLEQNGGYWGKPSDDLTAIHEIGRLRQAGASFIAFAWPAFWWLDYYSGMRQYLRAGFRCIHEDDCLVVFDLRENGASL